MAQIRLRDALIVAIYPAMFLLFVSYNDFPQYDLVSNHKIFGDGVCYNDIKLHYLRHVTASAGFLATYISIFLLIRMWRAAKGAGVSALFAFVISVVVAGQLVSKLVCS
ncbi:hypothetical protein [Rhizobium sp. NZLR4b]|uniref:hypothetical protein n=1 Tax=Rhizobium sp. NZLR4b TaxID=2731102 RepID=UPI001C82A7E3|nr:hypothetical protein [Rhizobium sp. NZLR4b]MBX5164794.1 hypothetical protein [Rhizobium sp. NZLR4b]